MSTSNDIRLLVLLDFMIPKNEDGLSGSMVWIPNPVLEGKVLKKIHNSAMDDHQYREFGKIMFERLKANNLLFKDFSSHLLDCWFTDHRVMASYNLDKNAPFPSGAFLPETDWGILENVFNKNKLFRQVE